MTSSASIPHIDDLIYSTNAFLHIHDKPGLLRKIRELAAPSGLLLFADYCIGVDGPEMRSYVDRWRYEILARVEWKTLLESHGFVEVFSEDATPRHSEYCHRAREAATAFYAEIFTRRIRRIELGQQHCCIFAYRVVDG